jgi:rhamnulokinase
MAAKIAEFCQKTGQPPLKNPGEIFRALLEGLALRYRKAVEDLDSLTGHATQAIYLVGGGSRNRLLCQFTADVIGCPVIAGPAEATASATILLQALARGQLSSLRDIRQVIRNSSELAEYEPHPSSQWEEAYALFKTFQPTLL